MKQFLFLDFDGVLHGEDAPHFSNLRAVERCLLAMPEVVIVISSSWRQEQPLEELKQLFSAALRDRIIGVTPTLACSYDNGGRQREIATFLSTNGWNRTNASWRALDDMKSFFDDDCSSLVLVDGNRGFGEREAAMLLAWYAGR